jgi:hypothetical protein
MCEGAIMSPIVLPPSTDRDALGRAIAQASAEGVALQLEAGTHFTTPGRTPAIEIGAKGLRVGSVPHAGHPGASAIIARPDGAIDPQRPDFNHGLFFVPSPPTAAEINTVVWRTHQTAGALHPFQFGVILRGDVEIFDLTVDCNMGAQGLAKLDARAAEHSAMLAFAGRGYDVAASPTGVPRRVFVGFRSVALRNVHTIRGGFADDIWFTRGYFTPNIQNVIIENVTTAGRVSPRRATIGFSALCQNIEIHGIDVYNLHLEDSSGENYDRQPRASDVFKPSTWTLTDVTAERLALSAKGKVYTVDATNLNVTAAFAVAQAGGTITNSALHVGAGIRLDRMNNLRFDNVTWHLSPDAAGNILGLKPTSVYKEACAMSFRNNRFLIDGTARAGSIVTSDLSINTENRKLDPGNRVMVSLIGCSYPQPFGRSAAMPIAVAHERGLWTFARADFGDRNTDTAIQKGTAPEIVVRFV